jgi:fructose 1,6-bisphosphate aldolase/phosphatase
MKITLTAIKADIGSIGGHLKPSLPLMESVARVIAAEKGKSLIDYYLGSTGDDIAILMTHTQGTGSSDIHGLAWRAFKEGTDAVAKVQGLYGAGQDLLKDAFSGNVRGMGPAVAEMEFPERPAEPFVFFAADKTDPGAFNLPFYLGLADPMYCSGLILSPKISKGFRFRVIDVAHTECPDCGRWHTREEDCRDCGDNPPGERLIELNTPEDLYNLAALLRDNQRFVIEEVFSRDSGERAAVISTTRLHNIAGKYTGKDDPIALVRTQGAFPATGEILMPFEKCHLVAGFMRGSHNGPLMPCRLGTDISYFDGPPVVTAAAFSMRDGLLTGPADCFDHPFWDEVRRKASRKAVWTREQGFSGPAMLPMSELEYGGIVEKLAELDSRFVRRP